MPMVKLYLDRRSDLVCLIHVMEAFLGVVNVEDFGRIVRGPPKRHPPCKVPVLAVSQAQARHCESTNSVFKDT